MADERELIILDADEGPARKAVDNANAGLDSYEKKGASANAKVSASFEKSGETIIRVSDRSRNSLERLAASAEKRAATAGLSGVDRLIAEQEAYIKRLGNDEEKVNRVTAAFARMIAVEKQRVTDAGAAERERQLQKEARAAEEATRANDRLAESRRREHRAAQEVRGRNQEAVSGIEQRAAIARNPNVRLILEEADAIKKYGDSSESINRIKRAYAELRAEQEKVPPPRSLTQQIVEAGILLEITRKTVDVIKEATIGSTLYAARTEQLGVALNAVAKANNVSAGTAATLERNVSKLGVTTQDAREALSRLIAANVDYTKAARLAAAAQDVGRISGEGTAASFQRLVHAIISAQPELLRQVGLNLSFEESYKRAAKAMDRTAESLSESEKLQIRTNDVLRVAANYNGVYASSLDTVGGRLLSLERKANEARNAIGERFQGEASATLKVMEALAEAGQRFPGAFISGGAAVVTAMGAVGLAIGGVIGAPVIAGFGLLTAAIGQVVLVTEQLNSQWRHAKEGFDALTFDPKKFNDLAVADAKATAASKFREAALKSRSQAEEVAAAQAVNAAKREEKAKEDAAKAREQAAEKAQQAEKHTRELLLSAQAQEHGGLSRILGERTKLLEMYGLTAKAIENINRVTQININKELEKIQLENRKAVQKGTEENEKELDRAREGRAKQFQEQLRFEQETLKISTDTDRSRLEFQEVTLQQSRDAEIRSLEGLNARTAAQKIEVEQRKMAIEERFILQRATLQAEALNREIEAEVSAINTVTDAEIAALYTRLSARQITEAEYLSKSELLRSNSESRVNAIIEAAGEKGRQLESKSIAEMAAVREDSHNRSAQIMYDANQAAFDKTRDAFENLLDQMFGKAKNWGDIMKSLLKATLLTPLKQFASATFAGAATGQSFQMGPGGAATVTGGGGMGSRGILGSIFGMGMGGFGGASNPASMLGPGGTSGFAGPVGMAGGSGGAGVSRFGGFAAQGKGMLANLRALGNIGFGPKGGDFGGETAGSFRGVGGAKGGGMLLGGGLLAMDGLRRGGLVGLGETTAGGALIGAKFGGPVGAAIGAGIGAIAGTIRLFIKGAEDKAIKKIQSLYGIKADKSFARTVVGMAKQTFGGDLDLAIRSPQVRDLIELYAMSTGQKFGGASSTPRGVSLSQAGGMITQNASYSNGSAMAGLGGSIPTVTVQAPAQGGTTILQLDPEATRQILSGNAAEAIQSQPELIATANARNTRVSLGRRESAAATLGAPGLITA